MITVTLRNKQSLSYDEAGQGPILLLLHGFPLDREMWRPQIVGLASQARVIALDLPGFGGSSLEETRFTIESAADSVAEFLLATNISERVTVGGLSMGGYVAMAFARRHPDRLRGLILADTRAEPDDEIAKANRAKSITLAQEKGAAGVIEAMIPKLLAPENIASCAEDLRRIASRQSTASVLNAIAALRDRPDAKPGLKSIAVPTLVIVGDQDAVTPPSFAEAIAHETPGSKLVVIPGAGHMSNLENPAAFNEAVSQFLQSR